MSRTIKQENWDTLANTVLEVLCVPGNQDLAHRIANSIRTGKPPADYLQLAVAQTLRCIRRSFGGCQIRRAQSLLDTLQNYGLIDAALNVAA